MIMLIGGIWHGPSVTFTLWGGAHGVCLAINHLWRGFRKSLGHSLKNENFFSTMISRLATFLTVIFLWVIFRSDNLNSALSIIQSLLGLHSAPDSEFNNIKINEDRLWFFLFIAWFAPNTREIMSRYFSANNKSDKSQQSSELESHWYHWYPNQWWAALTAILFIMSLLGLTHSKEFIYFQF